jgi:hypothetical protein
MMHHVIAGFLIICATGLYSSAAYSQQPARTDSVSVTHYLSAKANSAKKIQRAIVHSAERERWWMLFVGVTLVGYRLIRQHQIVFESSFLS